MRDSFVANIEKKLDEDEDVILLTGDLGFGIFNDISQKYESRFVNVGVAEQNMIGIASGLSLMGKKTFCYSIANFSFMRGLEQFRNGAVYHNVNTTLVCSGGGFTYGQLGFTHFAIEDYGILSTFGSVDIFHPSTSSQVRQCLSQCIDLPGPKYLRLEKAELNYPELSKYGARGDLVMHMKGGNQAVIAIGGLLEVAMRAADAVADRVAVYSLIRHGGLNDREIIDHLASYRKIIVMEEHVQPNSVGQKLRASGLAVDQMCISDTGPGVVGDQNYLRHLYGLTSEALVEKIKENGDHK